MKVLNGFTWTLTGLSGFTLKGFNVKFLCLSDFNWTLIASKGFSVYLDAIKLIMNKIKRHKIFYILYTFKNSTEVKVPVQEPLRWSHYIKLRLINIQCIFDETCKDMMHSRVSKFTITSLIQKEKFGCFTK